MTKTLFSVFQFRCHLVVKRNRRKYVVNLLQDFHVS